MTLAQINAIQPGTVVSPNGAILRQATGLPVPNSTSNLNLGVSGLNTNTLMVFGLGALVLLLAVKK
jgi:hypothetical protein